MIRRNLLSIIIIAFLALGVFGYIFAAEELGVSYRVFLYYDNDNNSVSLDRDERQKVVLVNHSSQPTQLSREGKDEYGNYKAQIVSFQNEILLETGIDLRAPIIMDMPADFIQPTEGKVSVELPYFTNAKEIKILSRDYVEILNADVSFLAKCNENKICELSKMENPDTCSLDCQATDILITEENSSKNKWLWIIISLVILGIAGIISRAFYKRRGDLNIKS